MLKRSMETKPRYTKAHSKTVADELLRLGWTLSNEFREPGDKEPYEYLFEWLRVDAPVYPEPGGAHEKA